MTRVMDLAYDRYGSGSPLVLLHGIGSHRQAWAPVIDRLASVRDVIAIDLPGFGSSAELPPGSPSHVDALTGIVQAFCNQLGLDRPHVAGNSLGGAIALEMARRGVTASATALAPVGFWSPAEAAHAVGILRTHGALARRLRPLLPLLLAPTPARAVALSAFFARPHRLPAAAALAAADAFADAFASDATLSHTRRYIFTSGEQMRVPVTVAWGTRDRLLVPGQAARARDALPQARHVWLRGCGHVPMSDDPEQVANVLLTGSQQDGRS